MSIPPVNEIDCVSAFRLLMEKRHIESRVIEEFVSLWRSSVNPSRLPCPLCYAAGGWGQLRVLELRSGGFQARCSQCNTSIPLFTPNAERPSSSREPAEPRKAARPDSVRWELSFSNGPDKGSWTWRLLRMDGSIEQMSEPKSDFGKAMRDAMQNGFRPSEDFWVIKRQNWITYFDRGRITATGPNDETISRTSGESGRGVEPASETSPDDMIPKRPVVRGTPGSQR